MNQIIEGMDFDTVELLGDQMRHVVQKHIWARGHEYFHHHRVQSLRVDDGVVFASVEGSRGLPYAVQLDVHEFRMKSYCTCPHDRYCKHMVAVFFVLYDGFADTYDFLAQVTQDVWHTVDESAPVKRKAKPRKRLPVPDQEDGSDVWLEYMDQAYERIATRISSYGFSMDILSDIIRPLNADAVQWPAPYRELYRLFVLAFLVRKADALLSPQANNYYARQLANRFMQACIGAIATLGRTLMEDGLLHTLQNHPKYDQIVTYMRDTLTSAPNTDGPSVAYQVLTAEFADPRRFPEEIERLQLTIAEDPEGDASRLSVNTSLLTLYMLAGQDAEAISLALKLTKDAVSSLQLCIQHFLRSEKTEKLAAWLRWVSAQNDVFDPHRRGLFADLWFSATTVRPELADDGFAYLRAYLPTTRRQYNALLMATERYRTLVEGYMLRGVLPSEVHRDDLGTLEKADRSLLLPWYHQSVERVIRAKNRDAYKLAARWMKKMQTHYKKLKQVPTWDAYVTGIMTRYSRYRALHEEMKKKGLIL